MDDRNMPEDDNVGPFEYENDQPEPDHPRAWVVDRESERGIMPDCLGEEDKRRLDLYDSLENIHIHRDTIEFNYGTLLCSMCRDGINLLIQKKDIPRLKEWWTKNKKQ